jgi:hypothetical protein
MQENALIVASLLTGDPTPLLHHPSVYSCCLARNEARWCDAMSHSSWLESARREHRFVYCCVIAGARFDVTVLAWCKYATIPNILGKMNYSTSFCKDRSFCHFLITGYQHKNTVRVLAGASPEWFGQALAVNVCEIINAHMNRYFLLVLT